MELNEREDQLLSQIEALFEKLPKESATRRQLTNYIELFHDSVMYLLEPKQNLAFIGNIGTGKTTAICHILNLLDAQKPILSTGSGRTTLCEVEIRRGIDLRIDVEPHSVDEVESYLKDFSQSLIKADNSPNGEAQANSNEVFKLSAEVERALRNMLSLSITRKKDSEGKRVSNDPAKSLVNECADIESFSKLLLERINLSARSKTAFICDSQGEQNNWLHETFKAINSGTCPSVGLAKRIVITVPQIFFNDIEYDLNVIDTKGIDQTVNRQDIDMCLTNNRTISVICSRFNDAPDKTMSTLLENAKAAGLTTRIAQETILLILDREQEAENTIDIDATVGDKDDGREIRKDQIVSDLKQKFQLDNLDIQFFDAHKDNVDNLKSHLAKKVTALRDEHESRLTEIEEAIRGIEAEIMSQSAKQAKQQVKQTLEPWLKKAIVCTPAIKEYFLPLIREISDSGTYAASVRASVNRNGEWTNLDYYQSLASGARSQIVEQIDALKTELLTLLNNMLSQNDLQPAYALLKQLKHTTEKHLGEIYQHVFAKGRAVYESELKNDNQLWRRLDGEWGMGHGYKGRIASDSQQWFQDIKYTRFERDVSNKATEGWQKYLDEIQGLLGRG